jgi:hypothetical protein
MCRLLVHTISDEEKPEKDGMEDCEQGGKFKNIRAPFQHTTECNVKDFRIRVSI